MHNSGIDSIISGAIEVWTRQLFTVADVGDTDRHPVLQIPSPISFASVACQLRTAGAYLLPIRTNTLLRQRSSSVHEWRRPYLLIMELLRIQPEVLQNVIHLVVQKNAHFAHSETSL